MGVIRHVWQPQAQLGDGHGCNSWLNRHMTTTLYCEPFGKLRINSAKQSVLLEGLRHLTSARTSDHSRQGVSRETMAG
jgi:hypothetical protein